MKLIKKIYSPIPCWLSRVLVTSEKDSKGLLSERSLLPPQQLMPPCCKLTSCCCCCCWCWLLIPQECWDVDVGPPPLLPLSEVPTRCCWDCCCCCCCWCCCIGEQQHDPLPCWRHCSYYTAHCITGNFSFMTLMVCIT